MVCAVMPATSWGQAPSESDRVLETPPPEPQHSRILGIIPNYRTFPSLANYKPLTSKEKFKIAAEDAFDPGTFVMSAAFAGEGQLTKSEPAFHQGVTGYARYFASAYADFAVADFMTEAVYPTLLHQDPRYFRRGTGSGASRLAYAAGQIFWTRGDSGRKQFNISELAGNATSVAISNAYYPSNRDAVSALTRWGMQLAVDMTGNFLKEFWPDLRNKLTRKPHDKKP